MVRYIVKSPVKIDAVRRCDGDEVDSHGLRHLDSEHREDLSDAVDSEMKEMGPKGLAEYLDHRDSIKDVVESIIVRLGDEFAEAHVVTNEVLTPEQEQDLMDYISGQYSDGWGEGFEQREFSSYQDRFSDECETVDEDGNIDVEYEEVTDTVELFAHFWQSRDFNITIEKVEQVA